MRPHRLTAVLAIAALAVLGLSAPATSAPLRATSAASAAAGFANYTVARPGANFTDVAADAVTTSGA